MTTDELIEELLPRAGLEVPGGLRRAEAALDERALPARARRPRTWPRRLEALSGREVPPEAVAIARRRCRPSRTSGRSRASWCERPAPRREGVGQGDGRRRARAAGAPRARRWPRSSRSTSKRSRRALRGRRRAAGGQAEGGLPADPRGDRPVRTVSPGIFESVAALGREETLARIDAALARAARLGTRRSRSSTLRRGHADRGMTPDSTSCERAGTPTRLPHRTDRSKPPDSAARTPEPLRAAQRGSWPPPDGGVRGPGGLSRAGRVPQPRPEGRPRGAQLRRRRGPGRRIRRSAGHHGAADRQPHGAAQARARSPAIPEAVDVLTPEGVETLASRAPQSSTSSSAPPAGT